MGNQGGPEPLKFGLTPQLFAELFAGGHVSDVSYVTSLPEGGAPSPISTPSCLVLKRYWKKQDPLNFKKWLHPRKTVQSIYTTLTQRWSSSSW